VTCDFQPLFTLRVNGREIFCKGGDWGMEDAMKQVGRDRLEPYVRMQRDAHLNLIRLANGQSMEESLYSLCDQYGIMVWNELWPSSAPGSMQGDLFYLANARDAIFRYRSHPSIVIWGASGEGAMSKPLEDGVGALVRDFDGRRYESSPERARDLVGMPLARGLPALPALESLQSFIPGADLWPISDTWTYHDYTAAGQGPAFTSKVESTFGAATDVADFAKKAEMLDYSNYRQIYEEARVGMFEMNNGVLLARTQPAWPSLAGQLYSWDDEPTAALFGVEKACEPVHIQMAEADGRVAVINEGMTALGNVRASAMIYALGGKQVGAKEAILTVRAATVAKTFTVPWPTDDGSKVYFARLELHDAAGRLLSDNFYWHAAPPGNLTHLADLARVPLTVLPRMIAGDDEQTVTTRVTNTSSTPALMLRFCLQNAKTGARVLPVYYQDNYLSLLPGESREIVIHCPTAQVSDGLQLLVEGFNVNPQKVAVAP